MNMFSSSGDDHDVFRQKLLGDISVTETDKIYVIHKQHNSESLTVRIFNSNLVFYAGEFIRGSIEYQADSEPEINMHLTEETEFRDNEDREYISKTDFLGENKKHILLGKKEGNSFPFSFRLPVKLPFGNMTIKSHHDRLYAQVNVDFHISIALKNKNVLTLGGLIDPNQIHLKIPLTILPEPILEQEKLNNKVELLGSHGDFKVSLPSEVFLYNDMVNIDVENLDKIWHKKDIYLDLLTELEIHGNNYETTLGMTREGSYKSHIQTTHIGVFEAVQGVKKTYQFKMPLNAYPFFQDGTVKFRYTFDFYNSSSRAHLKIHVSSPVPPKDRKVNSDDKIDHFLVTRKCKGEVSIL